MKQALIALLLFVTTGPALTQPASAQPAAAQNPLRGAVAQGATSIAWRIDTHGVYICCCDGSQNIINHGDSRIEYDQIFLVATVDGGKVTKVKMTEPNCPLKSGTRLVENVTPDASLDFLLEHVADGEKRQVAAIAMHDHPRVVTELIQLARNHRNTKVRRDAIFWLGQRAGDKATAELERVIDEDPEDAVREHAVFAVSQLPRERSVPILIKLVKTHNRPAVRKRAMFWLAQTGDPRALDLIEEILNAR